MSSVQTWQDFISVPPSYPHIITSLNRCRILTPATRAGWCCWDTWFCTLLSKLYYVNAHPPTRIRGIGEGVITRGCPNSNPKLNTVYSIQLPTPLFLTLNSTKHARYLVTSRPRAYNFIHNSYQTYTNSASNFLFTMYFDVNIRITPLSWPFRLRANPSRCTTLFTYHYNIMM